MVSGWQNINKSHFPLQKVDAPITLQPPDPLQRIDGGCAWVSAMVSSSTSGNVNVQTEATGHGTTCGAQGYSCSGLRGSRASQPIAAMASMIYHLCKQEKREPQPLAVLLRPCPKRRLRWWLSMCPGPDLTCLSASASHTSPTRQALARPVRIRHKCLHARCGKWPRGKGRRGDWEAVRGTVALLLQDTHRFSRCQSISLVGWLVVRTHVVASAYHIHRPGSQPRMPIELIHE
jgi:hypothetical protein